MDDLRHADALIHVVDVSGTTDSEGQSYLYVCLGRELAGLTESAGKVTRGYDPSQDIEWLRSEVVRWVLGNLMQKW